jgi:hypothetical protein
MKRTIVVLAIIALAIIGISFSYQNAMPSEAAGCCQTFRVVDPDGVAFPNCTITVAPCSSVLNCRCTTGLTGQCTICNLVTGKTYTATASCGSESATVTFVACVSQVIVINVQ